MNLRQLTELDARRLLSDSAFGFGWDIVITSPEQRILIIKGYSSDISQVIDPDTGQIATGRVASVTVPIRDFQERFLTNPRNIADNSKKPWLVEFQDLFGKRQRFKVVKSNPDNTIGMISLILGVYQ